MEEKTFVGEVDNKTVSINYSYNGEKRTVLVEGERDDDTIILEQSDLANNPSLSSCNLQEIEEAIKDYNLNGHSNKITIVDSEKE